MTSASSSRRTESRLLDSAVRDAVAQDNGKSGIKRLRSVVVGSAENPDLPSEANGRSHLVKPRLDMGLQGTKVPPGVAVALKAAAAAAEDVNNNSMKSRMRSFGSVWDRLGNKSSEGLGIKEIEAHEARVAVDKEEGEDTWEDTKSGGGLDAFMAKRPRWTRISERLGPRQEEDIAMASDTNPGGFGYGQGKRMGETKWFDSVGKGMRGFPEDMSDEDERFGDAVNYADGGFFGYGSNNDPPEDISRKFQESNSLFYRLGERGQAQNLPHGLISGLSGAVNFPNKVPNIHINSNARYLLSNDADITLNGPHHLYSQLTSDGPAALERQSGPSPAVVGANDVLEMKKRMRQVQLEMTKLRAKQAEVSKEAQKVVNAPISVAMKGRSQEEIDLHSVCVLNIHFAATKEAVATHFSNCGDIVRVTILTDKATGKPRGSAYVEFSSKDSVEKALNLNDSSSLLSRTLKVVRKDAATDAIIPPPVGRQNHLSSYTSMRAPGKFMRGNPLNKRRPISIARPFGGTAHLQWKRETSSPAGKTGTANFGQTNGSSLPRNSTCGGSIVFTWGHQLVNGQRSTEGIRLGIVERRPKKYGG
ncbi:unnamed protein product [Calypogeia fissa]